jgi:hypothetical protein
MCQKQEQELATQGQGKEQGLNQPIKGKDNEKDKELHFVLNTSLKKRTRTNKTART